jgi:parvulin-like peptidyl-prolyl isomerase
MRNRRPASRRPLIFLAAGAVAGIVLAAAGLAGTSGGGALLPADAVARVNDAVIRKDDYERIVRALATDRRQPIHDADRQHIIDRLIEEELLIQRALELRLADHDTRIRKDLTVAMIDAIAAPAAELNPPEAELKRFYDANRELFAQSDHVRARQIWCRVPTLADSGAAHARATAAAERLRGGEDFAAVRAALGDNEIAPLPDTLLPPAKLADYIGPTALRAVLGLQLGEVTDPIRSSTGYHVLQLIDTAPGEAPPFASMKPQVLAAYRKQAADAALRAYLDDLRSRAEVEVLPLR